MAVTWVVTPTYPWSHHQIVMVNGMGGDEFEVKRDVSPRGVVFYSITEEVALIRGGGTVLKHRFMDGETALTSISVSVENEAVGGFHAYTLNAGRDGWFTLDLINLPEPSKALEHELAVLYN